MFGNEHDNIYVAYLVGFTMRIKTASVSEFRVELKEPGATKMAVVVPMIFRVVISPVGTTQHVVRNKLQSANSWTSRTNVTMLFLVIPSVGKLSKEQSYLIYRGQAVKLFRCWSFFLLILSLNFLFLLKILELWCRQSAFYWYALFKFKHIPFVWVSGVCALSFCPRTMIVHQFYSLLWLIICIDSDFRFIQLLQ